MTTSPISPESRVHSQVLIVHPTANQKTRYEELIEKSFKLQKEEVRLLPLVGRVTALIGTSSVGKSSIIYHNPSAAD